MADGLHLEVLGRLVVRRDGEDVTPRGALQRRLLAALALRRGEVVGADHLADLLWPDGLPANHQAALQTHVFRLRRLLPAGAIQSDGSGYRLCVEADHVDAPQFERAVYDASHLRSADPATAVAVLDRALATWRGTPFEELGDLDDARIEGTRLAELHRRAKEERIEALLGLGRHGEVLADAEALAARHPLQERPHALLLQALAVAGRRPDAMAVYERYRRAVGDELGIEPSPALRELHDRVVRGEVDGPAAAAPSGAAPADAAPTPAPTPRPPDPVLRYASSFHGRDGLVAEVRELLAQARLVTLVGTGGVGKTRLAAEVCAAAGADGGGRRWFCELAAADPTTVTLTVAAALGVDERAGSDLLGRIGEVLVVQDGLLVLDNCEHVIDAAAELAEAVLGRAPGVRILATSRERLAVDGEHLVPVGPLPVDGEGTDALDLFVERARAVRAGWQPTPEERAVVAEVCRRLDGLPLAIELAAARLHTLTLDEVSSGLARSHELLTGGRRTTARHRSLVAAIAWSYDLLEPAEREAFDAISQFHSPFLPAAAADVLDIDPGRAQQLLSALVERSLVHRVGDRYGLYESLRQVGDEHLRRDGTVALVRERHARHHAAYAERARARLRAPGEVGVLRELDGSLADLRAAERWFAEHGTVAERLEYALSLRDYGFYRMRPEVLGWAEAAADAATAAGESLRMAGDAYAAASLEAWNRGDLDRGTELIERGRAAATASGEGLGYYVLENLGHHALIRGRLEEALGHHEAAASCAEANVDPFSRVESMASSVLALGYADDPRTAAASEALAAELPTASEATAAWAWYVIGEVLVQSDPDRAAALLARSLEHAERCGATFVTMVAGASAASIEARTGDPRRAAERYRELLELGQRAGVRVLQWTMLRGVAELLVRVGDHAAAATLLGAVTSPGAGHEIFGADLERLGAVRAAVRDALGASVADVALARGAHLDDDAAVAVALRAFAAFAGP